MFQVSSELYDEIAIRLREAFGGGGISLSMSFRSASKAREPGIQRHQLAYLDSGSALRAVRNDNDRAA